MKFLFLSDTHTQHRQLQNLPYADVLIHGGDVSGRKGEKPSEKSASDVLDFINWFCGLNYKHKIFVAGNHDVYFANKTIAEVQKNLPDNVYYLCNSGVEIESVKFWGSPVSPIFHNYWAFTENRGKDMAKHWALIPKDTDVLITHCPPFGILDSTKNGEHIGCADLLQRVQEVEPIIHFFGHVHESYGTEEGDNEITTFINGSVLNKNYEIVNEPVIIKI